MLRSLIYILVFIAMAFELPCRADDCPSIVGVLGGSPPGPDPRGKNQRKKTTPSKSPRGNFKKPKTPDIVDIKIAPDILLKLSDLGITPGKKLLNSAMIMRHYRNLLGELKKDFDNQSADERQDRRLEAGRLFDAAVYLQQQGLIEATEIIEKEL